MVSTLGWFALSVIAAGGARDIEVPRIENKEPVQEARQYFAKLSISQTQADKPAKRISAPSFFYVEGADAKMTSRDMSYEVECEVGVRIVGGVKLHRVHGSVTHRATPTSPMRTTKFNLLVRDGRRDAVLTDDGLLVELEAAVHRPKQ